MSCLAVNIDCRPGLLLIELFLLDVLANGAVDNIVGDHHGDFVGPPIATLMGYVVFAVAVAESCVYLYWLLRRQCNN